MPVSVGINPKSAPNYKSAYALPVDVRIDGVSLNFTETYDEDDNLSKNTLNWATGTVNTDIRNATAGVTAFFRGAGNAMEDTTSLPTYLYDGSSYIVKVMPTVSSVSHDYGYGEGSQTLTIEGTSLDGDDVTVTVDDLTCELVSYSETQIICKTAKKVIDPNEVSPDAYVGQQGLTRYVFNSTNKSWHTAWRDHIADSMTDQDIWPNIDYIHHTGINRVVNGMIAWEGFFQAPATGQYMFL